VFGTLGLWVAVAGALPDWTEWLVPVLAILLVVTTVNRVRAGLAETPGASHA
jgi:CDP-diacylglycerol---glycerol-3-phosphate 3-phosphatidyltransferase